MIVNKSMYPLPQNFSNITKMHQQMESLQGQLASGKRHDTLAEYGADRAHDLNLRGRIGRIEGYLSNITTLENRLSFTNNAVERLDEIEAETRKLAMPNAYGKDGLNMVNASQQAGNSLKEVIDVLNTDIAGKHIFGGHVSDQKPVTDHDTIMEGVNGRAGFRQVASERIAADAGADGLGRLAFADSADARTVTLAEDGDHPFGFKLQTLSDGPYFTGSAPGAGAPRSLSVSFDAAQAPKAGDTITIGVSYPDAPEKTHYISMTATDKAEPSAGHYTIGGSASARAENFQAALEDTLSTLTRTEMNGASTMAAADDFFNAGGAAPQRVDMSAVNENGEPLGLVGDPDNTRTVRWYNGETAPDARSTVTAQVDENTKARVGVTADETGFNELIKTLSSFAVTNFNSAETDPAAKAADQQVKRARFDAMAGSARIRLSEENNTQKGSIENVALELGLAAHTIDQAKDRHGDYKAQFETMLADIEQAPIEEVAMQLINLQTRLQASFQATTMVNNLSLVNYLG